MSDDEQLYYIYRQSVEALQDARIKFLVGGGTAVAAYGRARTTKDFDIFLNKEDLLRAMQVLNERGFFTSETEKPWLYKAQYPPAQIDLITRSAGSYTLDEESLRRGRLVAVRGQLFPLMSPEDLLVRKISSTTEGRPDWYDALSVLREQSANLEWDYLLRRAERHPERLLSFLLFAVGDLPMGRRLIPKWVLGRLMAAARRRLNVTQEPIADPLMPSLRRMLQARTGTTAPPRRAESKAA